MPRGYGASNMNERFWTVDEANAAIARVSDVVARARSALQQGQVSAAQQAERVSSNGHRDGDDGSTRIAEAIQALEDEGIVLRDLERGLVDFSALSPSGRRYWLCWVVGEPAVDWWHWPEDGFAGRTPITDPPP
jgi:hypothetical protein